jgi:hypothetical protein
VVVFTFEKPLDSPGLCWVMWQNDHFVRFTPPRADGEADVVHVAPARSGFVIG